MTDKPQLVLTRGYPGSGKSTFACEWVAEDPNDRVRLNRDDIRRMMFGKGHGLTYMQEKMVSRTQKSAARAHLRDGRSIIIDDTNLRLRFAKLWADMAVQTGAEFIVHDIPLSADECMANDMWRDESEMVGPDVIETFARRYPMPWPEVTPNTRLADPAKPDVYVPDKSQPIAWIVDIDGTLAHHEASGRSPYDWSRVSEDEVDDVIANLVDLLNSEGFIIVLVSGRDAVCRADTETWLAKHDIVYDVLHMRPEGDNRPDHVVKAEIFDNHIRHQYHVLGVLDDRSQVVRMWRSMGLKTLQVQDGDF